MSTLRVNQITSTNSGAPNIENGFTVPADRTAEFGDFLNVTGSVTTTSISGNGSGLTNVSGLESTELFAYMAVF